MSPPLVSRVVWGLRVVSTIMPPHYDSFTKIPNNTKKATLLHLCVSLQHVGIPSWSWHAHRCLTSLAKGIHLCVVGTEKGGRATFLRSFSTKKKFRTNYLLITYLTLSKKTEKYETPKINGGTFCMKINY